MDIRTRVDLNESGNRKEEKEYDKQGAEQEMDWAEGQRSGKYLTNPGAALKTGEEESRWKALTQIAMSPPRCRALHLHTSQRRRRRTCRVAANLLGEWISTQV